MPLSIKVNLRVTGHCNQGGRKYMEDMFSVAYQQTSDDKDLEYAFFGIFDGHGGGEAATYAKEHLMDIIVKQKNFWSDKDEDVLRAIRDGYVNTHYAMWRELEKWPRTASGLPSTAGTTASIAFIRKGKIYIGHVGDSGIILGYQEKGDPQWKAKALTRDHKPESVSEMTRIQKSGGKVISKSGVPRVVWNRPRIGHKGPVRRSTHIDEIPFLAVARSLGDLWSYNSELDTFVVSPEPDVKVITVDVESHRCLIFGTDGLWNMLTPQGAVAIVQAAERHNEKHFIASQQTGNGTETQMWINPSKSLVDRALERWSSTRLRADNTSVVTLMLDPPGPSRGEVLLSRKKERIPSPKCVSTPLNIAKSMAYDSKVERNFDDVPLKINESSVNVEPENVMTHKKIDDVGRIAVDETTLSQKSDPNGSLLQQDDEKDYSQPDFQTHTALANIQVAEISSSNTREDEMINSMTDHISVLPELENIDNFLNTTVDGSLSSIFGNENSDENKSYSCENSSSNVCDDDSTSLYRLTRSITGLPLSMMSSGTSSDEENTYTVNKNSNSDVCNNTKSSPQQITRSSTEFPSSIFSSEEPIDGKIVSLEHENYIADMCNDSKCVQRITRSSAGLPLSMLHSAKLNNQESSCSANETSNLNVYNTKYLPRITRSTTESSPIEPNNQPNSCSVNTENNVSEVYNDIKSLPRITRSTTGLPSSMVSPTDASYIENMRKSLNFKSSRRRQHVKSFGSHLDKRISSVLVVTRSELRGTKRRQNTTSTDKSKGLPASSLSHVDDSGINLTSMQLRLKREVPVQTENSSTKRRHSSTTETECLVNSSQEPSFKRRTRSEDRPCPADENNPINQKQQKQSHTNRVYWPVTCSKTPRLRNAVATTSYQSTSVATNNKNQEKLTSPNSFQRRSLEKKATPVKTIRRPSINGTSRIQLRGSFALRDWDQAKSSTRRNCPNDQSRLSSCASTSLDSTSATYTSQRWLRSDTIAATSIKTLRSRNVDIAGHTVPPQIAHQYGIVKQNRLSLSAKIKISNQTKIKSTSSPPLTNKVVKQSSSGKNGLVTNNVVPPIVASNVVSGIVKRVKSTSYNPSARSLGTRSRLKRLGK